MNKNIINYNYFVESQSLHLDDTDFFFIFVYRALVLLCRVVTGHHNSGDTRQYRCCNHDLYDQVHYSGHKW